MLRSLALTLVPLVAGCGILAGDVSCDLRAVETSEPRCQERTGFQGNAAFAEFCDPLGGDGVTGNCPDEDLIVGGCRQNAVTGNVIDWYYEPMTREQVAQICDDDGTELVDP